MYLAALTLKSARASDVARLSNQSRSHTYLMLRALEERGLVAEVERGKVLHFVAESPEALLSHLEHREEEIKNLKIITEVALPQLKSLTKPLIDLPRVTLLHGLSGMKHIYRSVLCHEFVGVFNAEMMYAAFGENIVTKLFGKHVELQGKDLLVPNAGATRYITETPKHDGYEVRLLPDGVTFETDTIVYGDTVVFFAYDADLTTVRIENNNIADTFREWFKALWNVH